MNKTKMVLALAMLVVLAILLALTTVYFVTRPNQRSKSAAKDKVTVQLKWLHQAQFAGFYAAEQLGYYEAENLDVDLKPGGLSVDVVSALDKGEADFSVMSGLGLIKAIDEGHDFKAIASVYQRTPVAFISLKETGIDDLGDFIGHSLGIAPSDRAESLLIYRTMMDNKGLDWRLVKERDRTRPGLSDLQDGQFDIQSAYAINEVLAAEEDGLDIDVFLPHDYGVSVYGDVIVAHQELIDKKQDLIKRFLAATLKGLEYAVFNPDEIPGLVQAYNPNADADHEKMMMINSQDLILPSSSNIGRMDSGTWEQMADIAYKNGFIKRRLAPTNLFTEQFMTPHPH